MKDIALRYQPNAVCLVPENRLELTTEGGLDVVKNVKFLGNFIAPLKAAGCKVSIFLAADREQIDAALNVGATTIELHTGAYCELHFHKDINGKELEFQKLKVLSEYASSKGLEVHAGHGLTLETVAQIASIREIQELNIGHSIIADSIFVGLDSAIKNVLEQMNIGRSCV
jgi:pyridoxine 5-phosphate synthase